MPRAEFAAAATFRLRHNAVECDEDGPRVGGIALLRRTGPAPDARRWRLPPLAEIERGLASAYGCEIGAAGKLGGLRVVADALDRGELARAQIATLLLRLPDPPPSSANAVDRANLEKRLRDGGLLKDWDPDRHPRAGVAPNPGWFAPTDGENASPPPKPNAEAAGAPGDDRKTEVIPICIAEGIAIVTDEFGNKSSSRHYECLGGGRFYKAFPGSGDCPPLLRPNFLN